MNVHQDFPAGRIITNGLGGNAGDGLVITTQFHLYPLPIVVTVVGTGGGSRPLAPGEINTFYKPVQSHMLPQGMPDYLIPKDFRADGKIVKISVQLRDKTVEKEYVVHPKTGDILVKILNLLQKSKDSVSVLVKNIQKVSNKGKVLIKNLIKHKKT